MMVLGLIRIIPGWRSLLMLVPSQTSSPSTSSRSRTGRRWRR